MNYVAFGCGLTVLAAGLTTASLAQIPDPEPPALVVPFDGPTPDATATVCPGETSALPTINAPASIVISPESRTHFIARNSDGHGSFLIAMRQDGQHATIVPPTGDIDDGLRAELLSFGRRVTMANPLPGCARWAGIVVAQFNISDGAVRFVVVPPPPKGLPATISADDYRKADEALHPNRAAPSFVGPTPDASGTACPGETEQRRLVAARNIEISPDSASFFLAHNTSQQIRFVITLRLDGTAAIAIPNSLVVDDALRTALAGFAQHVTLRPPIEACARPAAILIGTVAMPSGDVTLRQLPLKK